MTDDFSIVKRRGRPKGTTDAVPRKHRKDHDLQAEPGDISKMVEFDTQWRNMPKVNTGNLSEILDRIDMYFTRCIEWGIRPCVAGMCAALGVTRQTWYYWISGQKREYSKELEPINAILESLLEQYGLQGKLNPATQIFLLKNHFGYRDTNEVVLTPSRPDLQLQDEITEERLRKKYLEAALDNDEYDQYMIDESKHDPLPDGGEWVRNIEE